MLSRCNNNLLIVHNQNDAIESIKNVYFDLMNGH